MATLNELEEKLSEPSQALVAEMSELDGDILVLGVAGKVGPSLAKMAKNAIDLAGVNKRVIGISRFSEPGSRKDLEDYGIATIQADLLDDAQLQSLPEGKNVIYMAGQKFGTTGREYFSWAMNSYLPGRVAEKYKNSRIVVFSSGNVYPFVPLKSGGASEEMPPAPLGEYAQSVLGRERVFEYFSHKYQTPVVQFRLNYAIDLRYGVIHEIAKAVKGGEPIDLAMGHANVIWQGDVNDYALRSFKICSVPPRILNVTGPETVSVRWLAERLGELFGIAPVFVNEEQDTALLNNSSLAHSLFGYPRVSLRQMIEWTVAWMEAGGQTLNKPTHFQERAGKF